LQKLVVLLPVLFEVETEIEHRLSQNFFVTQQ